MILLYGNGYFAKELYELMINRHLCCKFIDLQYFPEHYIKHTDKVILASGKPDIKFSMYNEIKQYNPTFKTILFSKNIYSKLNIGSVVSLGAVIAPGCDIGSHVLINYNASVGHDVTISDFSTISPNSFIGGNCKIGLKSYIGAGSCVKENTTIGSDCIIGMGAVVLNNVPDDSIVIGNPGKIYSKEEWSNKYD